MECVQLKVCEGCGCLWYRPQSLGTAYCKRCEIRLKDFPVSTNQPRRPRRRHRAAPHQPLVRVWAVAQNTGGAE